jgi:YbbR domain-containing protein
MAWHPFRNPGLKLAALGLATLLWITVSGQQAERSVRVPLEFRKKPVALEITGTPPESVEVWIQGASSQISGLGLGDVVAYLDLTDVQAGAHLLPLRPDQVLAPIGVRVTRVVPPEILVSLEASAAADVPVVPAVDGQPAAGYVVEKWTVDPQTVTVVGPESRLKGLHSAVTERVSIAGAKATVTATVAVVVNDGVLRLREPHTARVIITIAPVRVK